MLVTTARQVAEATLGQLIAGSPDVVGTSVAIDSRDVEPGSVFVALRGSQVDGHDYAEQAARAGATILLVSEPGAAASLRDSIDLEGSAIVLVDDGFRAVQALAVFQRSRMPFTVIGVTGSTGKTSAKSFLASVLARSFNVVATEGNQNNELGCPLTLLRASEETQVIVVEMGMRAPGEIAELAAISRPQIGVVTNVGPVHLESLGSLDAVADAKGELFQALPDDGLAVLLDGTEYEPRLRMRSRARVESVGFVADGSTSTPDIYADEIETGGDGCVSATVHSGANQFDPFRVRIPIPGMHHMVNALFAVAVASRLGVEPSDMVRGIEETKVPGMRFARVEGALQGVTFINDAYNANPTSVEASIRTFASLEPHRRHIALLGDMLELGLEGPRSHEMIGEICAEVGLDAVVGFGDLSRYTVLSASRAGVPKADHFASTDIEIMVRSLAQNLRDGDLVLLKGSRGMALERIIDMLASSQPDGDAIGAPDVR